MSKKVYWVAVVLVLVSGLVASIYFGVQPKTVPKIALSYFSEPKNLGHSIVKRLQQELLKYDVLALGIEPGQSAHSEVIIGLLEESKQLNGQTYPMVIVDSEISNEISADLREVLQREATHYSEASLKGDWSAVAQKINQARAQGQRVLVVAPNIYSTQVIPGGPGELAKREGGGHHHWASISMSFFPASPEDEANMTIPCSVDESDTRGTGRYGCMVKQKGQVLRRKLKPKDRWAGAMDLIGVDDYMVLLRPMNSLGTVKQ